MASSSYFKFDQYVEDIHHGVHNFSSDQIKIALVAAANAPADTDEVLADLTVITQTNLASDAVTTTSSGQTGGTYKLALEDKVILASGGDLPAFRFVVFYNDTPTSPADPLLFWYDYGEDLVLEENEQVTVDMSEANGVLQVA